MGIVNPATSVLYTDIPADILAVSYTHLNMRAMNAEMKNGINLLMILVLFISCVQERCV